MGTKLKQLMMTVILTGVLSFMTNVSTAQCSICTKTTQQLGEKPAKGMNSGILYLAFTPLAIVGVIGYRWMRANRGEA